MWQRMFCVSVMRAVWRRELQLILVILERRHSSVSAFVTGTVFILLGSRSPSSADIRNEWIYICNPTIVVTLCKRPQLMHKYNFD